MVAAAGTAQTSPAEAPQIAARSWAVGLEAADHPLPSQCSIEPAAHTAQTLLALLPQMPFIACATSSVRPTQGDMPHQSRPPVAVADAPHTWLGPLTQIALRAQMLSTCVQVVPS